MAQSRADVYQQLILEYQDSIIEGSDIHVILDKLSLFGEECLSQSEHTCIVAEDDNAEKTRLLLDILLGKKQEKALYYFIGIVDHVKPENGLSMQLAKRLDEFNTRNEKNKLDVDSEGSLASASICNESEDSCGNSSSRTPAQLKDELEKAKAVTDKNSEEIRCLEVLKRQLEEKVSDLETKRDELQSENAGLREDKNTLQKQITDLDGQILELQAELERAKMESDRLKHALHSRTEQFEELRTMYNEISEEQRQLQPLRALLPILPEIVGNTSSATPRSRLCSVM